MHRDEQTDSLRDELGLELEQLVAVEVAPDLRAKVQARVACEREREGAWWPRGWQLVSMGAVAAILLAVIVLPSRDNDPFPAVSSPEVAVVLPSPARPLPVPIEAADVGRSRARVSEVRAISSRNVASVPRATTVFRILVAQIRDGRVEPAVLPLTRETGTPLEPLGELTIEPVAIEPIAPLPLLSGEQR
jgi:hypothetical protein